MVYKGIAESHVFSCNPNGRLTAGEHVMRGRRGPATLSVGQIAPRGVERPIRSTAGDALMRCRPSSKLQAASFTQYWPC